MTMSRLSAVVDIPAHRHPRAVNMPEEMTLGDSVDGPSGSVPRSTAGPGPVLHRAARVLAAFTADRPSLTQTDIARRAGLPLTTTHRLVTVLADAEFLEREPGGAFHIGLRLWEIASLAPRGLGLREVALPFMEDLSQVTRENVQLAVREGLEAVFVERIAGRSAVAVHNRVGGRFALYPTGVGRVLLAHAPEGVQEAALSMPMTAYTSATVTDPATLRRLLADVRLHGAAIVRSQVTTDALSVAAPIRDADGTVVAAVSLVVAADTANATALTLLIQTAARGISRALKASTARGDTR
nr:HTH-type transcriptional regulator KipR [Mycolicibacterium sp.]